MSYNKFPSGSLIEINGAPYWPQGYSAGRLAFIHQITGEHFRCKQPDGAIALPSDDQFDDLLLAGEIEIKKLPAANPVRKFNDEAEWSQDQAEALDSSVARRVVICRMLDDAGIPRGDAAIQRFLDVNWTAKLAEKYGPHEPARTIREWLAKRGRPGDRQPRHMVRLNGRSVDFVRADTISKQLVWLKALNGRKAGLTVKQIHAEAAAFIKQINAGNCPQIPAPARPLSVVAERTVRRCYNALESHLTLDTIIEKQAAEQDWLGAGKPLTADFVMQRVIFDHTELNVHVACSALEMILGRPWLTLVIDVKSRAVVAYIITFINPCIWTVGEALRRMALPKRPPPLMAERYPILSKLRGKASEIILDNAVEFRSHTMEAAARNAGFSVRFCPVKMPRYRAICERAIGTITRQICDGLPGRTMTIHDARRLGYDAEDHTIIMLDELEAIANQAVADYNAAPHDGLGDRQPALMFEKDVNRYGINNFADFESFRRDTMQIQQNAQLTPSGIKAFGSLRYHNIRAVPELLGDLVPLEPQRQRRDDATATVDFRFDPADISRIYVWNRKTRKYFELQCSDERYADGMPLWLHDNIRAAAQAEGAAFNTEEERLVARGRMVQAIRNISPAESAASRKRVAELLEIPRIRQITGNIVHLLDADPAPVSLGDFIANDRAVLTSIDHEILSTRPAPRKKSGTHALSRRRSETVRAQDEIDQPIRQRRLSADRGGYQ